MSDELTNPLADPFVEVQDTDSQSDLVQIDGTEDGVVTVTMNRADKKNAFNAELIAALREAFETLKGAEGVRVVFLEGAGETFSAGADLEWMRDATERSEGDNRDDAMQMAIMLNHLYDLPMLTVALVRGGGFGGGAGLVAACDMAVATADAKFAFSETRLGLIAATISPYVVGAIGPRKARSLFATAKVFGAEEALRIGLVDEIAADAAALEAAKVRIAKDIMACAPDAVAESKTLVEEVAYTRIDHRLMDPTARRIARARVGAEGQEGVRAFLDRRSPDWLV